MWLLVQTLVICTVRVPNGLFCVLLSVLATSLSLQVFLNSSLYFSFDYKIISQHWEVVYACLMYFSFLKKRKSISFSITENRVITFLFVVEYGTCF